ncbi:MAG: helix-turn-helix transcriptional regulator [Nonomuraea sp.]|nr:helix-turn-helix transcriptional regulator [Nonomuraea sp.]
MDRVELSLGEPPLVSNASVGVHGLRRPVDVFRLPDHWQLHLYGYSATLVVAGSEHAIRPGYVSLVPPGVEVEFRYRGRSEHLYAHLRLPGSTDRRTVPLMQDAGAETPLLSSLMRSAIAATPTRAAAELWTVLWRVAHLTELPQEGLPHPAVSAAIAHIETHLGGPLTVPEIARAARMSHNHLTRLFREETGDTVVAYVRRRRMARARHLLRESTLPIASVAAEVGIPDLQAFNKTCHRELGASPRSLRASVSGCL